MEEPLNVPLSVNNPLPSTGSSKRWVWFLVGGVVLVGLVLGGLALYGRTYTNRVLPHVRIGAVDFGRMTHIEVRDTLIAMNDKLLSTPIKIDLVGSDQISLSIPVEVIGETESYSYFSLDINRQADALLSVGKHKNPIILGWRALTNRWSVTATEITINDEQLSGAINEVVSTHQVQPQDARLVINTLSPFTYTISPSNPGNVYSSESELQQIREQWSLLRTPQLQLQLRHVLPAVTEEQIQREVASVPQFLQAPIKLTFTDPDTRVEKVWTLSEKRLSELVTIVPGSLPAISLHQASTTEYLIDVVGDDINVPSRDAKFEIDANGRVTQFQGSQTGVEVDYDAVFAELSAVFAKRPFDTSVSSTVVVTTRVSEPEITTADVNDLGITHLLGVGISNFSGSPSNRIKNIRNAVQKLNGVLIKPGEEFSAIDYTKPYTIEGGYLPEKVIKGDQIIPEIGGGLCQVGTTLFRMAMMSGMEITERRNHSLVVSYYNDLSNGLPGTDATIYDPSPDFRFKNDTDGYILLQTEMDVQTGELRFSLWGKDDGRRGSYSKPVVHNWIGTGAPRIIETTSLAPGVKECQNAYRGANTSFTYTREFADGRKEDRVFESHYRALPQICLVGVEALTPPPSEIDPLVPGSEEPLPLVEVFPDPVVETIE